ncbi:MAG: fasciclin domain-containing protein [Anaerolineales bacterium]|nr:fasciclin domain-containing protein [Anaerolineales bacterium]MCB9127528.1 fasciclin domain-containing protein [Ardenticatenales bacterium]
MKKRLLVVLAAMMLMIVGILPAAAQEDPGDIPTVAIEAGSFTTLVDALVATGLDEALAGEGPFTVFAPTDDAFAALPEGTLESLDEETLAEILKYHVVAGEFMAADVVGLDGQSVETLQGESVAISIDGDTVMVNDATVVTADVAASNGVIHVIDKVLLPPSIVEAMAGDDDGEAEGEAEAETESSEEPATMPETGAPATTPWLPVAALLAGLMLLGGAAILRTNER